MKAMMLAFGCCLATSANADWYYHVMKVVCDKSDLRVIDYSEYNEVGQARGKEPGAIDVDNLSTWKRTANDLNVPDKPLPHTEVCKIPSGEYKVILTNAGGGYSAPYPVVNVTEITNPKAPRVLVKNLHLDHVVKNRYEIIFSKDHPEGLIIDE
ncbi:MAG: hypothetical protein WBM28_15020 [Burkholderiales bacterium]